jgi:hypothetical protein
MAACDVRSAVGDHDETTSAAGMEADAAAGDPAHPK